MSRRKTVSSNENGCTAPNKPTVVCPKLLNQSLLGQTINWGIVMGLEAWSIVIATGQERGPAITKWREKNWRHPEKIAAPTITCSPFFQFLLVESTQLNPLFLSHGFHGWIPKSKPFFLNPYVKKPGFFWVASPSQTSEASGAPGSATMSGKTWWSEPKIKARKLQEPLGGWRTWVQFG